jgi:hypothetical protein
MGSTSEVRHDTGTVPPPRALPWHRARGPAPADRAMHWPSRSAHSPERTCLSESAVLSDPHNQPHQGCSRSGEGKAEGLSRRDAQCPSGSALKPEPRPPPVGEWSHAGRRACSAHPKVAGPPWSAFSSAERPLSAVDSPHSSNTTSQLTRQIRDGVAGLRHQPEMPMGVGAGGQHSEASSRAFPAHTASASGTCSSARSRCRGCSGEVSSRWRKAS